MRGDGVSGLEVPHNGVRLRAKREHLEGFKDFWLRAKAKIWFQLSYSAVFARLQWFSCRFTRGAIWTLQVCRDFDLPGLVCGVFFVRGFQSAWIDLYGGPIILCYFETGLSYFVLERCSQLDC